VKVICSYSVLLIRLGARGLDDQEMAVACQHPGAPTAPDHFEGLTEQTGRRATGALPTQQARLSEDDD
jgi:hypothetical protein